MLEEGRGINSVVLYSKGGNLDEAMKIGRLIRKLMLLATTTWKLEGIEKILRNGARYKQNGLCTSSCFFIFVGGVYRDGNVLGIHRPYLSPDEYKSLTPDDVRNINRRLRKNAAIYLEELDVSASYVGRMFSVSSTDIDWISAEEVERDLSGFIPSMDEWLAAKCTKISSAKERAHFNAIIKKARGPGLTEAEKSELPRLFDKKKI